MSNWKAKFTSRKFWAAVIGFVVAVVTAFKVVDITPEQVELLGWAFALLMAYIFGEGFVDSKRASASVEIETEVIIEEED